MVRESCASCGAWVSSGIDSASWNARQADFEPLHHHVPGSPLVVKMTVPDAMRDAFDAVVDAAGYVGHQFTPVGGGKLAVFVSRPAAASIKGEGVVRHFVTTPDELAARLA